MGRPHHNGHAPNTFHLANPRSLSLAELVDAMNAFGLSVERVDPADWRRRTAAHAGCGPGVPASAAYLALSRCLPDDPSAYARHRTLDLFQATDVTFDQANTTAGLAGTGLTCPPPDRRLLHTYFRALFPAG